MRLTTISSTQRKQQPRISVWRSGCMDWKKDWNWTGPNWLQPDHRLQLLTLGTWLGCQLLNFQNIWKPSKNRLQPVFYVHMRKHRYLDHIYLFYLLTIWQTPLQTWVGQFFSSSDRTPIKSLPQLFLITFICFVLTCFTFHGLEQCTSMFFYYLLSSTNIYIGSYLPLWHDTTWQGRYGRQSGSNDVTHHLGPSMFYFFLFFLY